MAGLVIRDLAPRPSNYRATTSLPEEMDRQGVVGIADVDTRSLTRHLRSAGAMRCGIFSGDALADRDRRCWRPVRSSPSMAGADLTGEVTTADAATRCRRDRDGAIPVAALDLGIKTNTPRDAGRPRDHQRMVLPATVDHRRTSWPSGWTGCSCPTARATRPPRTAWSS